MALPFFYVEDISIEQNIVMLDEDTSRHITQVLRMQVNEPVLLTNGKGIKATALIVNDHRKKCEVKIESLEMVPPPVAKITIAISLIKNSVRWEWFLEKATEVGISEIIPLRCTRTEKEKFRPDRMKNIMVSAMLQSQQCWLPLLHPPTDFKDVLSTPHYTRRYIAHCLPEDKHNLKKKDEDALVLIGPEGDFTTEEINEALQADYQPVTLGPNRLRTETAAIAAAVLLCCGK